MNCLPTSLQTPPYITFVYHTRFNPLPQMQLATLCYKRGGVSIAYELGPNVEISGVKSCLASVLVLVWTS